MHRPLLVVHFGKLFLHGAECLLVQLVADLDQINSFGQMGQPVEGSRISAVDVSIFLCYGRSFVVKEGDVYIGRLFFMDPDSDFMVKCRADFNPFRLLQSMECRFVCLDSQDAVDFSAFFGETVCDSDFERECSGF